MKLHRADPEGECNTLCGIEIVTTRDQQGVQVKTRARLTHNLLKVVYTGDINDFDCLKCRQQWRRITRGD
jgi:hypothetical protein